MYRCGRILERTMLEPNKIHIKDDYAIIDLYDGKNNKIDECYIDIEDIDKVKDFKWYLGHDGYIRKYFYDENKKVHTISIHKFLMNPASNKLIDHINQNKKDNRRCNLRIVNASQERS